VRTTENGSAAATYNLPHPEALAKRASKDARRLRGLDGEGLAMTSLRKGFERVLEIVVMLLLSVLCVIVLVGVAFRTAGSALVWYDEVASVLLAWLTYYGSALAALKRAHIGFPGFVNSLPRAQRQALFVLAEAFVIAFFTMLAWVGWQVFEVLQGDTLVTLDWVSMQLAQSVIPVGAVLFVLAELVSLPEAWRAVSAGPVHAEPALSPDTLSKEVLSTE
jgi:TRAP-type C4-dicarboxylate transport system permease small subunit